MKPIATAADVLAAEASDASREDAPSTWEAIRRSAAAHPDAPALTFFMSAAALDAAETWSYRDVFACVTRTANAFGELGVGKDGVVAFVLPNLPETHFTIWGGQAAGVVAAFNPLLEPATLARLLAAAGAEVLVTVAPFPGLDLWPRLRDELSAVPGLRHVVLVDMSERLPGPQGEAARAARESADPVRAAALRGDLPRHIGLHDFWTLVAAQPDDRLTSDRVISPDDRSSFFCTGGTTGLPKIAVRRHRNEVANAAAVARFMGEAIGPGKTLFCGLPLFHVNGVLITGLLPLSKGAHIVLGTPQGYRGDGVVARFWEIVERFRVNFFSGVPTLYAGLLQVPIGGRDVSSLEYGLCGAAPMPIEVFRAFQERTGVAILEGYGLTEATCVSSINPPAGDRRVGSIGLRLPRQDMEVVRTDADGTVLGDCETNEVGLLVICGPNVFEGYLNPEQNVGVWVERTDGRRWLNTGDLARRDADGYFWLVGRRKELIIRGGHNIDPATIEEPLHRHPDVLIAAAVGRPDAHAGELPVAYVQLKPGATVTETELMDFGRAHIGERAAIPKSIRIVDSIPLTAVGKIFKPALKSLEIEAAIVEALAAAEVPLSNLTVADVPGQGTTVTAEFPDAASAERARVVLGGFAYPFVVRSLK